MLWIHMFSLFGLLIYSFHRVYLKFIFNRSIQPSLKPSDFLSNDDLPVVTLAIAIYNEPEVAKRVIEKSLKMIYPRSKLDIQILDDSDDGSSDMIKAWVQKFQNEGHPMVHIKRNHRQGYKAGALQNGLSLAKGQFIAIFDADFLPDPYFFQKTLPYFRNPEVGMVQTKWAYINPTENILTYAQKLMLDAHLDVEHVARLNADYLINFNGSAGVFRKKAIEESGQWHCQTLTEDLELSIQAQIKGWKFIYTASSASPSELPKNIMALKSQQYRWSMGASQTTRKLLLSIFQSKLSLSQKIELTLHITSNLSYVFMLVLLLSLSPVSLRTELHTTRLILYALLLMSTVYFFYHPSKTTVRNNIRNWLSVVLVGSALSINNALACLKGFISLNEVFVKTPKWGGQNKKHHFKFGWIECAEILVFAVLLFQWINQKQTLDWMMAFAFVPFLGLAFVNLYNVFFLFPQKNNRH